MRAKQQNQHAQAHRHERRNGQIPVNMRTRRLQFVLSGAFPFQQALARNESSDQRTNDGVEGEQSLMRQKDKTNQNHESRTLKTRNRLPHLSLPLAYERSSEPKCKLSDGGKEEQQQGGYGPVQRPARQTKPACDEEGEDGWFDQRTAQVVEDFPA